MKKLIITLCMAVCSTMAAQAQTIDTLINKVSTKPFSFAVQVPDGNYRVDGSACREPSPLFRPDNDEEG